MQRWRTRRFVADWPSRVTLEGGTNNQWAPPFDFLARAFLPFVSRMGPQVSVELERHGFFPAGGGRFTVSIEPTPALQGFDLLERGENTRRSVTALVSNLPRHIAEREVQTVLDKMNWETDCGRVEEVTGHGPGNVVFAAIEHENVTEFITGFGRVGASAENVAKEVGNPHRRRYRPIGHGECCAEVTSTSIVHQCCQKYRDMSGRSG